MYRRAMLTAWFLALAPILCLSTLPGCGGSKSTPAVRTGVTAILPDTSWAPPPENPRDGGVIVFALAEVPDPASAPVPGNESERTVFRNFYETLLRVDRDGNLRPGLADRWQAQDEGRTWVFQLRPDARYWDGSRVSAADVKAAWTVARGRASLPDQLAPLRWLNAENESVRVLDAQHLMVTLPEVQDEFPLLLAHPSLAVAKPATGDPWPLGSGPCRPVADTPAGAADLRCLPHHAHPQAPVWNELVFRWRPELDPRDLPAAGCDALLTTTRDDAAFFRQNPRYHVAAMPWHRLYLLLLPALDHGPGHLRWLTGWRREDLAADVVAADALPAPRLYLLGPTGAGCPQLTGPVTSSAVAAGVWSEAMAHRGPDVILHDEQDDDARRLAERLAALAARLNVDTATDDSGESSPRAEGISAAAFGVALQSGAAGAYLVCVERNFPTTCFQFASLLGQAGWLQRAALYQPGLADPTDPLVAGSPEAMAAWRLTGGGQASPLVATREHLVTRVGLVGIVAAFDGALCFERAGWLDGSESRP